MIRFWLLGIFIFAVGIVCLSGQSVPPNIGGGRSIIFDAHSVPTASPSPTPGTPLVLGGLQVWYSAAAPNSITTAAANKVSAWADLSGNGVTVVQSTPSAQPVVTASAINGLPAVSFSGVSGTNNNLLANTNLSGATSFTMMAVINDTNITQQFYVGSNNAAATAKGFYSGFNVGTGSTVGAPVTNVSEQSVAYTGFVVGTPAPVSNTGTTLQEATIAANSKVTLYTSGTQTYTSACTTTCNPIAFTQLMVGEDYTSHRPLNGLMGELLIYNNVLSTNSRQVLEGCLAHKWGITLPISHPYYNYAPSYWTC